MEGLLAKLYRNNHLKKLELLYLLEKITYLKADLLFAYARKTRVKTYQRRVYLRALVEFSNHCRNNCWYCGLRRENKKVERYRLLPEAILSCCASAYQAGYRTVVLQSGEDKFYTAAVLADLIQAIKKECPGMAVTLSIGEAPREKYYRLYRAGADRFLLRHETVSADLYERYHPGMSYRRRLQCLKELKGIGYQTGAGFIVGLPGQTDEVLAEERLFLKEFDPEMVGIGPFIPHPETPLGNSPAGSVEKTLILLALIRLLLPEVLLPVTTAVNTLDRYGWEKGLAAGANVIMPVVSPAACRRKYEIYKNKAGVDYAALPELKRRVEKAGFELDMSRGDSYKRLQPAERSGWGRIGAG
ncbi:MAG: [FeFe] hydrogenase H-cluster radical SAM maturase HydE [Firmicutes bacterium]|nr:[FeFe] hydrogenase H-cluster radical SAM maturase HydE [Bacillota bacterium]